MAEDTNRNPNPPSRGAAGSVYFPLFQHMADNHGLTLLDSEMEDICRVVEAMRPPLQPCQLSGDTVLMSALEAMSAPSSSSERAQFTERLLNGHDKRWHSQKSLAISGSVK
jgi:hypothetical protein